MNTVSYVFYFQIVTSALVGSVLLAIGAIDYHHYAKEISNEVKLEAWVWVMYSIIALPVGMLLFNKIFNLKGVQEFHAYLKKPIEFSGTELGKKMVLLFMAVVSFGVLVYVFMYTKDIPLWTLIVEGDPAKAAIERVAAKNDFEGIHHIRSFLGLIMMPVFSYYAYIFLRKQRSMYNALMFGVIFSMTALLMVYDTQKAPIAFFILGFWIVEVIISNGISKKKALLFIGAPVLLILMGYTLTTDKSIADQFLRANSAFYGRTFLSGYFSFPLSLQLFPEVITEPSYYAGIPRFFLDPDKLESAKLLMMHINPEGVRAGSANLFSGYFLAEAWANYGYLGILIAPFIVGIIIQSVHVFLLKQKKEPFVIAFYGLMTTRWLVGAGFVNFLFLKLIIFPIILYYLFKFAIQKIGGIQG